MKKIIMKKEDVHRGTLVLVNRDYPLRVERERRLCQINTNYPEVVLEKEASVTLKKLLEEICGENEIALVSGYRSKKEQERIYQTSLWENGGEFTRKYVAIPNHSEHQTGFAIDVGEKREEIDFICPAFTNEGAGKKFRAQSYQYGFIERYTKEKEEITKIAAEEWHFRYVGYPHSMIIKERGLCLEEYIELLKDYPYGQKGLSYLAADKQIEIFYIRAEEETVILLPENSLYKISGNNVDGFILTLWR